MGDAAASAMQVGQRPQRATVLGSHQIPPLWLTIAALLVSPGSYLSEECNETKDTQCAPCKVGLYTATKNHMSSCHHCRVCSPGRLDNTALELPNRHTNLQAHAVNQPIVRFTYAACCLEFDNLPLLHLL